MHDPLPLLANTDFPPLRRGQLDTLQVNVGYRCNQSCVHCHVNAGPSRTEAMGAQTIDQMIELLDNLEPKVDRENSPEPLQARLISDPAQNPN